jgi:hypothetical protein
MPWNGMRRSRTISGGSSEVTIQAVQRPEEEPNNVRVVNKSGDLD